MRPGSAGSECVACHMPKIEQTIADVNVRAHTFKFITPAESDALKIPNACNLCHADKTTAWATAALKLGRPVPLAHGTAALSPKSSAVPSCDGQ